MINSIILALSVSIDSLGIGISYGVKNTKIRKFSLCLLAIMSIFFTCLSFLIGDFIKDFLSEFFTLILSKRNSDYIRYDDYFRPYTF